MGLKPETSLTVGLATAALVWSIYSRAMPSLADIRVAPQDDPDLDSSRKAAAWTSAGAVAFVSLVAKDPTIFIIGGAMVIAVDWWTRHGNANNPFSGRTGMSSQGENTALQDFDPDVTMLSGMAA